MAKVYEPLRQMMKRFRRFYYTTQTVALDLRDFGVDPTWTPVSVTLLPDPNDPLRASIQLHLRRDADEVPPSDLAVENRPEMGDSPSP